MAVLSVLVVSLFSLVSRTGTILQHSHNEVGSYQSTRFAFNLVTRTLSQSRMNVYQGYNSPTAPTGYVRQSDLNFVIDGPQGTNFNQGNSIFFQAPLGRSANAAYAGLPSLLNSVGYYLVYGKDPSLPSFLQPYDRYRFRLLQFLPPAEKMIVYTTTNTSWYTNYLPNLANPNDANTSNVSVVANNVILFLCWPRLSKDEDSTGTNLVQIKGGAYRYDSRYGATTVPMPVTVNQQPPMVQVTMVALDETSANRLPNTSTVPTAVSNALQGLFGTASEINYQADLATLESRLVAARLDYRIFNSTVPLLEAKWSK